MSKELSLISLYHEHTRNEGYSRVYVSRAIKSETKIDFVFEHVLGNVSIDYYYLDYSQYDKDDFDKYFYDLLDEIDLMIVLVDKEYLKRNEINEIEIATCDQKGIKVLPILVDNKYINEFNTIFDHIQCLALTDDKELFDAKLETLLRKYLLGKQNYNKEDIQKLFKKPVFISYRKKDVSFVREFLAFLRQDERFYAYQFWYDDFLNPGNNYDEEILEKLEACDLFILYITENIFEKGNYVKEIEYPYAIKHHKKIIAINGDQISKKRIYEDFPEIEQIYEVNDETIFLYLARTLPNNEINSDVDRYNLALAYYYGYIVEKNMSVAELLFLKSDTYVPSKRYLARGYYYGTFNGDFDIFLAYAYMEDVVNSIVDDPTIASYNVEGRELVRYLIDLKDYPKALYYALKNQENNTDIDLVNIYELFLDIYEASLLNDTLEDSKNDELIESYDTLYSLYLEDPTKYLYTYVRYSSFLLDLYNELEEDHPALVEALLLALKDNRNYDNEYLINTVKAYKVVADYYYQVDKEKAIKYYQDVLVYTLIESKLPLAEYYCLAVDKLGELGDSIYSDPHRNTIENRHFALGNAGTDRNRYDYLYASYLAKSDKAIDHIVAIYLYERYSLINRRSFIVEKINLYQNLFTDIQNNDLLNNIDGLDNIATRALEYLLYPNAEQFVYHLYGKLIYLYDQYDPENEVGMQFKTLFPMLCENSEDYLYDYIKKDNYDFFLGFNKEKDRYKLDTSRDDNLLNEIYGDDDLLNFDDFDSGDIDA